MTGVVVFIIPYFHKPIHQPFDDKHRLSSHEKLSFKLTNVISVIQGSSQTGSKNNFPVPTDYRLYFFHTKVPWGPPEGGTTQALYGTQYDASWEKNVCDVFYYKNRPNKQNQKNIFKNYNF